MSQLEDRLRDSSFGRAALDKWSEFKYLPQAKKTRYGLYAGALVVLGIGAVWMVVSRGGPPVQDATLKRAEEIRIQAAVEPPPATEIPADLPQPKGPPPRSVKGGPPPPE